MGDEKGTISPLAAILAIAATFILFMFLSSAIVILFGYNFALIFGELLIIIIPLGYMLYKKVDIKKYVGLEVKPKLVILGICLGVFLFLFDLIISTVLISVFGVSEVVEESNKLVLEISSSSTGLVSLIVSMCLAGICEEFTFRGFLQTSISRRYPLGAALFVSSLAFGLFHIDPQAVYTLSAFLLGLLLGYFYHRWRLYIVPAVAHATLNLIVLAISILVLS